MPQPTVEPNLNRLPSLRDFLNQLRDEGELVEVHAPVDLDLEIGAIARRSYETGSPAALFSNISGAKQGFRV